PKLINAVLGLGRTYLATGKISEAVAMLEASTKDQPRFAQLYFDLAQAYALSHNYKKAFENYQKVIELSSDTALTQKARIESQKLNPK
ncbi:MAG: TTC39/IML2 family protein, partial [Proteobacteria bacterium]|nr:TTC39/IML2 family protein [Pseudomonadota bacterium]